MVQQQFDAKNDFFNSFYLWSTNFQDFNQSHQKSGSFRAFLSICFKGPWPIILKIILKANKIMTLLIQNGYLSQGGL